MGPFVVFLALQYFEAVLSQIVPSPEYPIVQFCYSEILSLSSGRGCKFSTISNSVFKFGEDSKNVLSITRGNSKYLILKCKAPYPIRWLAHKPLGSLNYLANFERVNLYPEPFQYNQTVSISLEQDFSRILRCESYSNVSLAAELFLSTNHDPTQSKPLRAPLVEKNFFVDGSRRPNDTFIIPSVGPEFYDEHVVRLSQRPKNPSMDASEKPLERTIKGVWSDNFDVDKAVIGGYDHDFRTVYVSHVKGMQTRSLVPCYSFSGATRVVNDSCEYLVSNCQNSNAWRMNTFPYTEFGAVDGSTSGTNNSVYICRGFVKVLSGQIVLQPGYLLPHNRQCTILTYGKQQITSVYELLIDTRVYCNSYCKSRSIIYRQMLLSAFVRETFLVYWTSNGLWSDTFDAYAALKVGFDPDAGWTYICRYATSHGKWAIGVSSGSDCWLPFLRTTYRRGYQILISHPNIFYGWLPRKNGSIADGAVEGGHTESGEITFLCRAFMRDCTKNQTILLPGIFVPSQGTCNVLSFDLNMDMMSYEILVAGCSCGDHADDARMGLRQTGQPVFQSKYSCYSKPGSTYYMYFTNPRLNIISANLYYGGEKDGKKSIHCDPEEPYQSLEVEMQVGKCESVLDCDLKFSPMPPLIGFPNDSEEKDVEIFTRYNKTTGVKSAHRHGFVQCISTFRKSFQNTSGYFIKTDYMITGLDDEIYFLSKGLPNSSIVKIEHETQQIYTCTISTFVLLPAVYFEITYYDGQGPSKLVQIAENSLDVSTTEVLPYQEMLSRSWRLHVVRVRNVTKISCHARWASSNRWSSAEIVINATSNEVDDGAKESTVTLSVSDSSLRVYIVIGCCLALILFLVTIILILWRKYNNSKEIIRNLTEEEIDDFHNGTKTLDPNNEEEAPIENLAFNGCMVIKISDVTIESEVLGKGQYGIVYKGMYENQLVAVKSCRDNVDVEYFKAFLKEIKVMAFIGDSVSDRVRETRGFEFESGSSRVRA